MTVVPDREDGDALPGDLDRETHRTLDQMDVERPSLALVEAVAEAKGVDPLTLDPLGNSVDMDALDTVLQTRETDSPVKVSVKFAGYCATLSSYGSIVLRPLDSEAPGPADE